ncbi:hypothetical protein EVAR_43816_1 [Eumeta japonica]|uniref:Uncharacterized protein n=1 Tax=Eumeta variegata TaxID=151549 RepID=A0A4C1X120_EUMVA|nr:hypothetical protein EVAR_43816_1 [Eumeta japonica]
MWQGVLASAPAPHRLPYLNSFVPHDLSLFHPRDALYYASRLPCALQQLTRSMRYDADAMQLLSRAKSGNKEAKVIHEIDEQSAWQSSRWPRASRGAGAGAAVTARGLLTGRLVSMKGIEPAVAAHPVGRAWQSRCGIKSTSKVKPCRDADEGGKHLEFGCWSSTGTTGTRLVTHRSEFSIIPPSYSTYAV